LAGEYRLIEMGRGDNVIEPVFNWYALYVKSRHEFATQGDLNRKGVETFLPSVKRLRRWKDRKKFVDFPLFPGYLFVHIRPRPEDMLTVLRAVGAVTLISREPGRPESVSPEEIHSLKVMVESGQPLDVHPHLKEGERVRVRSGPFKSAEGVLARKEDHYVFLVNIELLGRSLGVRVYPDDLEAA
jgi:transcriptional antiterminator NusG